MLTYKEYKDGKDHFWSDIPHEKCQMVTKKKKVKRKLSCLGKKKTCIPAQQNMKMKTTARKRKLPNPKYVKKTKSEEIPAEFILTEIVQNGKDNKDNQPSCPIHLFVKSRTCYKIEIEDPLNMDVLQNLIKEHDNIPTELQMITHHGKLLRQSSLKQLESGDTIHVIVRGKGGGKSKPPKKESEAPVETVIDAGLQDVTSEIEFQKWLRETVKIPEELFHREGCDLNILDLMTFREYEKAAELKNEIKLPAGIAKKMFYFKNNQLGQKVKNYEIDFLKSFTIGHVGRLAKKLFTNVPNIETILDTISKECIDGFVIMLYANHIELEEDLNIKRAYARKLLVHAQNEIKIMHAESCQGVNDSLSSTKEFLSVNLDIEVKRFTNEQLHECHLFAIHSAWEEKKNELAESFLFWVLSSDILSSHEQHKLWLAIVKNMQTWLQTLPKNEQGLFTPGKSKGRFQYKKGKNVSVCETGEKMKSVHDVSPQLRKSYKNHILICYGDISKKSYVLKWKTEELQVSIGKTRAWTYKEDGFKQIKIIEDVQSDSTDFESKASLTPAESDSKGSGSLTQTDSQENSMSLEYYGQMASKYAPSTQTNEDGETKKSKLMYSESSVFLVQPRDFKHSPNMCVYFKDQVIDRPEGGSGMIIPSLEFKIFSSCHEEGNDVKPMTKFLSETLRFACGCLNRRRNGTIFFGIADDKEVKGKKYRHGQVVGFPILEVDSVSKSRYTDELNKAKASFDSPEANNAAHECIKDPVFVKISPSSPDMPLYVMEVDVEPTYAFCKGIKFKVSLAKIFKSKHKPRLFVRDGPETKELENNEEAIFASKLHDYDQQRQQEEDVNYNPQPLVWDHKYMADRLVRKLCKGSTVFDSTLWPILVSSKPTDSLKPGLYSDLSFIKNIMWTAVLEFDDSSMINGIGKHFFQSNRYMLSDGEIFRDVENNIELRNRLKLPENGVFIFCNGRCDQKPKKDHLSQNEWKKHYSPSVKGAINFFQQKSVINIGRAVIMFLLFATDFEGFLDIFGEMSTFFGSSQVILICPDLSVFVKFKEAALVQKIITPEDLINNCIVGMSWENCNECVNNLLGIEKQFLTTVPSSCGATVKIERNTEESLNSLEILSSTQCEHKKFTSLEQKQFFKERKELKFYQGNRVEWWNFQFRQVMERHCFRSLINKVRSALSKQQSHTRVFPIFLFHEPGAGGSTLARHILWEFRKEFRCAVVTKLVEKTASDIIRFWQYKETDRPQPALLLLDSVPDQKIDLDNLLKLIETQKLDSPLQLHICVLLICVREEIINIDKHEKLSVLSSEVLSQRVDDTEKQWLKEKIEELEHTSENLGLSDFKGEYFITFMILHSGFNEKYLLETVKYFLKGFDIDDCQFRLLMFVSLIIAYVSPSKCGGAIAVPIESCSELMGLNSRVQRTQNPEKTIFWENHLDGRIKIFLLIEPKENGSGKQIRMAHPNIAKTVLQCIQDVHGISSMTLKDIALAFLKSDILRTHSYAREDVRRLAVEMLIRRKKEEYDDDRTTNFSPLIEDILEESGTHEPAAYVLKRGFEVLDDCFVAHQLSRLYLHHKVYDEAKFWGEKAVKLNPTRSAFIHTLGNVYKQQFFTLDIWNNSKAKAESDDPRVMEALNLALEAFDHFCNASKCDKFEVNLLASKDAISTANCIAELLIEHVNIGHRDVVNQYFHDDGHVPEAFKKLGKCHIRLKSLFSICLEHIDVIDEYIYYSRRSYASKFNFEVKEHRNSRAIKQMVPDIMTDFAIYFGPCEITDDPPPYMKTTDAQDGWHRRCVLALDGRRLVSLFRIVQKALSPEIQFRVETYTKWKMTPLRAKEKLLTIQNHLNKIKRKVADDLLNMISVNIALSQLKATNLTSIPKLFENCNEIICVGRGGLSLSMAYLYRMMFQWPFRKAIPSYYDHSLLLKDMKYLYEEFRATKQNKPKIEKNLFKGENNEFRSVVLFYLAKGKGLTSFCHCSLLPQGKHSEEFWQNPMVQERLMYIDGYTRVRPNSGSISVIVDLRKYEIEEEIEIRSIRCGRQELTERPISFYLGFTLSGPVVCYIQPKMQSLQPSCLLSYYVDYEELSVRDLRDLLKQVDDLKKESSLNDQERKLLSERPLINEALRRIEKTERYFD